MLRNLIVLSPFVLGSALFRAARFLAGSKSAFCSYDEQPHFKSTRPKNFFLGCSRRSRSSTFIAECPRRTFPFKPRLTRFEIKLLDVFAAHFYTPFIRFCSTCLEPATAPASPKNQPPPSARQPENPRIPALGGLR